MKKAYLNKGEELSQKDADLDWFDFLMLRDIIWVGTGEYVAEKMRQYRDEANVRHIMLLQQFPGIAYENILGNMTRFAERVMPQFSTDK